MTGERSGPEKDPSEGRPEGRLRRFGRAVLDGLAKSGEGLAGTYVPLPVETDTHQEAEETEQ